MVQVKVIRTGYGERVDKGGHGSERGRQRWTRRTVGCRGALARNLFVKSKSSWSNRSPHLCSAVFKRKCRSKAMPRAPSRSQAILNSPYVRALFTPVVSQVFASVPSSSVAGPSGSGREHSPPSEAHRIPTQPSVGSSVGSSSSNQVTKLTQDPQVEEGAGADERQTPLPGQRNGKGKQAAVEVSYYADNLPVELRKCTSSLNLTQETS